MKDLSLRNVSFSYPGGFLAVDDVSIDIKGGENVAIVGQNGAGKTTTVKMINGLLRPTKGDVLVGDMNTKDYTTAQVSRIVGYVFQNPDDQIFHATVEEEVRFGPKNMKLSEEEEDRRVEDALKITGMDIYRGENPMNLPLSVRKFVTIAAVISTLNYDQHMRACRKPFLHMLRDPECRTLHQYELWNSYYIGCKFINSEHFLSSCNVSHFFVPRID